MLEKIMKKYLYISLFTLLGILLQFIVHALVEIWYIGLLTSDFKTWGLGLDWNAWFLIHHIATIILLLLGAGLGLWSGIYFWKVVYIEKRK